MKKIILVVFLVLASPVAAQELWELDEDTPLTDQKNIETYNENGSVTVFVDRYSLRVTVAKDSDEFDTIGTMDSTTAWVQIQYMEEIPRTFRIYIPDEYWLPIPKKGLESRTSEHTADMLPVQNRNYTSFVVRFDGPGTATFAVSTTGGYFLEAKDSARSMLEERFNITIPSISGRQTQWSYIEPSELEAQNSTATIPVNGTATIQYQSGEDWLRVPQCSDGGKVICRNRLNDSHRVHSFTDKAPMVRYKEGNDYSSGFNAAVNDLMKAWPRFTDFVSDITDGLF